MRNPSLLALLTFAVSSAFAADPAAAATSRVPAAELPAVSHWVYLSELPESADLLKDAAANGLTVQRLDRTSDKVIVTYVYADGLVASLGYVLLSSASSTDRVVPRPGPEKRVTETRVVRVVEAEPEVVYTEPRYYGTRYYRDPIDDFWLPLTLGVGLGWVTSYHGHHGGYYGHGYGGYHGGGYGGYRGGGYGYGGHRGTGHGSPRH